MMMSGANASNVVAGGLGLGPPGPSGRVPMTPTFALPGRHSRHSSLSSGLSSLHEEETSPPILENEELPLT